MTEDDRPDHARRSRPGDDLLGRSLALVRHLREGCPWDARQTPESLRPYLLEEAHETADAVLRGDDEELAAELGDLLLNVAFQIVLAEERGAFGAADVVRRLEGKMEARHPHVYGDAETPPDWEATKARERDGDRGNVSDPPAGLEPLGRALRVQQRAAALGFDWPSVDGALAKIAEETAELEEALERRSPEAPDGSPAAGSDAAPGRAASRANAAAGGTVPDAAVEREVGDLLLAVVAAARHASVHPARALEDATRTFERRVRELVRVAGNEGLDLGDASTEQLEALWAAVRSGEAGTGGGDG